MDNINSGYILATDDIATSSYFVSVSQLAIDGCHCSLLHSMRPGFLSYKDVGRIFSLGRTPDSWLITCEQIKSKGGVI